MNVELTKTQVVNEGDAIPKKLGPFIKMFLKRHPWSLVMFSIFVLYEAFIPSVNAYLLKMIIDGVLSTVNQLNLLLAAIIIPAALYVCVQIFMNIIYSFYRYAHLQFYPKIKSDIAGTTYHYLSQHSYRYFNDHFSGSLSKKIFDLCVGVEALLQITTHSILPKVLAVLFSSVVSYTVHPLFGVMLFLWAITYISLSYLMSYHSERLSYATSEAGNAMNGKLVDSIVNMMSAKLFANLKHEETVVFNSINNLMEKDRALQWYLLKANCVQGVLIAILITMMLAGLVYGRVHNIVTVGDFALILTLSSAIANNIYNIGEEILRFAKEVGNCRQALNIIVEPHEIQDKPHAVELKVPKGKIVFDNVQFQYQNAEPLFENKTVTIEPGQKVI